MSAGGFIVTFRLYAGLILLVTLACLGNVVNLSLFFGVDFLFGSIFVLLVLKLYGFRWGIAASALAGLCTVALWQHPYAMILFLGETLFIGAFYRGRISNFVLLDGVYWVLLGMPTVWFFYRDLLDLNFMSTWTVMLKVAVNGIFNALMASLILILMQFFKSWFNRSAKNKVSPDFSLYDILYILSVSLITLPILLVTVMAGRDEIQKIENEIESMIEMQVDSMRNEIAFWEKFGLQNGGFQGGAAGAPDSRIIGEKIRSITNSMGLYVTILDRDDRVIATTRPELELMQRYGWREGIENFRLKDNLYHVFPEQIKNPIKRWEGSSYVKAMPLLAGTDWTAVVESPVSPYRDRLFVSYIKLLAILLGFGLLAIVISLVFSRSIVRPINELAQTTTNLPKKMMHKSTLAWPVCIMSEMATLIRNFRTMADKLQQMFAEIRHLAYYDNLTGLTNRFFFYEELESVLENSRKENKKFAVFFIDLDRFKVINDTLGHAAGDLLLQNVAERLKSCMGAEDILSRMGGDEFTLILPDVTRGQASAAAQSVIEMFSRPIDINGHEIFVTPSIGISIYPEDSTDKQILIKYADQAMYAAKDQGGNTYRFYASEMNDASLNKMMLEVMLRKALENGEFEVFYQPRINLADGSLTGMEALIRWRHPEKGWIPPAQFIPVAEETGLIVPIGQWVLNAACARNKAWQDEGYPPVPVSVNLSVRQFKNRNLLQHISHALEVNGLDPQYLELEITENISMFGMEHTLAVLQELKQLGVKISIDDFGTGYSSLSYLKKFPIHQLKIDQSFVRDLTKDAENRSIIKAIISMAHSLGLTVVAEGVEEQAQAAILREMECDEVQGHWISEPLPSGRIEPFLFSKKDLPNRKV